jgi:hypothetical protein
VTSKLLLRRGLPVFLRQEEAPKINKHWIGLIKTRAIAVLLLSNADLDFNYGGL